MNADDDLGITAELPDAFPVTVIMERQPAKVSAWVDYVWKATGITVGNTLESRDVSRVEHLENGFRLQIYPGFQVRLYVDECDSYYHNLMSPSPHCYIVVRQDDDDEPRPFIVSLSFDEAHAYLEGDDTVFTVEMPPELYRWTESFVLKHYCPQQLKKRKRKDWRRQGAERPGS
jgi:hypothetical protein